MDGKSSGSHLDDGGWFDEEQATLSLRVDCFSKEMGADRKQQELGGATGKEEQMLNETCFSKNKSLQ